VDDEPNNKEAGQRGGPGGERSTHDQTLTEIVQTDAERDETGERYPRRAAPPRRPRPSGTAAVKNAAIQTNVRPRKRPRVSAPARGLR
jgi:hypothetical protein